MLEARESRSEFVSRAIAGEINSGSLGEGDRLPSERELCERFSVSRATVRRALADLSERGLVESRPGSGNFVAVRRVSEPPNTLTSFSSMGSARGLVPTARVLDSAIVPASLEDAETFGIAPGADVFSLTRVRLLDGLPVSVDHNLVPLVRAAGIRDVDFTDGSLYAALDDAGHGPVRADYTVLAVAASPEQARLLDLQVGEPVLHARTLSYDAGGRVVERGDMVYRGDRYRFEATLTRHA